MNKKIGYLRVSTHEQRPDRQIDGLRGICDELHIECLSAVSKKRPVYEKVMAKLEPGDTFVVWDLDRAFRSSRDAILEGDRLRDQGIEFQIATMHIDTNHEFGEFIYTVFAAFAQLERRTLSRRTKEGLAAARLRGTRLGRPPKLTSDQLKTAKMKLQDPSVTITAVAGELNVAAWTLTRAMRRAGLEQ